MQPLPLLRLATRKFEFDKHREVPGEFDHSVPASAATRRSGHDRRQRPDEGRGDEGPIGASRLSGDEDRGRDLRQGHTGNLISPMGT